MKITMKSAGLAALILLAVGQAHAATVNPFTNGFMGTSGPSSFAILALGGCTAGTGNAVSGCDTGKTNVIFKANSTTDASVGLLPHSPTSSDGGDLLGDNSAGTKIHGAADVDTSGTVSGFGANNVLITQGVLKTDSLSSLSAGIVNLYSQALLGCAGFTGGTCITLAEGTQVTTTSTFTGTNGDINFVNLTGASGITLGSGKTLTLVGNASTYFVIDISGAFSLTSGADIVLSGGITAANVLFNLVGNDGNGSTTGAVCFSSATTCTNAVTGNITFANQSQVAGIILAPLRDINLDGAAVDGQVISGNLNITVDDSKIVPEPGTLLALATGLAALGTRLRRFRRK